MSTKQNLAANFIASAWTAALAICLVPVYIHFIGIEAYGLVGTYTTLQAIAGLLDMGFTSTMTRELARTSAAGSSAGNARTLVRTMEIVYWAIAVLIGILVIALAPFLAHRWITGVNLSADTIQQALLLIGGVMLLRWPFGLYAGGLNGLQQQVLLSSVQFGMVTLRGIGAILILWLVSPTIQAYFVWQIVISALTTFLAGHLLWRHLPPSAEAPRFRVAELRKVWRFAAGMTIVSALGLALAQTDKVVLSRLLTLEDFGYYTLAGTVATSVFVLVMPVYNAIYPRFTQLATQGDRVNLTRLYHHSAQILSVILLPALVIVIVFAREVLFVWTGNSTTADIAHKLVALLAIGTGLQAIAHVPWALQLSHGWTRLGLYKNLISVVTLAPLIIVLTLRYGAIGGAAMWIVVNLGDFIVSMPIMHHRLMRGELRHWYLVDVALPLTAALAVAGLMRASGWYSGMPRLPLLLYLGIVWLGASLASALATPSTRAWLVSALRSLLRWRSNVYAK